MVSVWLGGGAGAARREGGARGVVGRQGARPCPGVWLRWAGTHGVRAARCLLPAQARWGMQWSQEQRGRREPGAQAANKHPLLHCCTPHPLLTSRAPPQRSAGPPWRGRRSASPAAPSTRTGRSGGCAARAACQSCTRCGPPHLCSCGSARACVLCAVMRDMCVCARLCVMSACARVCTWNLRVGQGLRRQHRGDVSHLPFHVWLLAYHTWYGGTTYHCDSAVI